MRDLMEDNKESAADKMANETRITRKQMTKITEQDHEDSENDVQQDQQ